MLIHLSTLLFVQLWLLSPFMYIWVIVNPKGWFHFYNTIFILCIFYFTTSSEIREITTWLDPRTNKPYPGVPTQPGQTDACPNETNTLPTGWEAVALSDGRKYFVDHLRCSTTWEGIFVVSTLPGLFFLILSLLFMWHFLV